VTRYQVVSLARSMGSGGDEIARLVADDLGFRLLDQEIIAISAGKAGVTPDVVARVEQTQPFLVRLLEAMGRSGISAMDAGGQVALPSDLALIEGTPERYEALIEETIREAAARKKVVIVGHGASIPLAGSTGVLRLFVTASPENRIERVMHETGVTEDDARKAVTESDKQRRDYLRRFYDVHEELPTLYDLVVNTDLISTRQAVDLIVGVVKNGSERKRVGAK